MILHNSTGTVFLVPLVKRTNWEVTGKEEKVDFKKGRRTQLLGPGNFWGHCSVPQHWWVSTFKQNLSKIIIIIVKKHTLKRGSWHVRKCCTTWLHWQHPVSSCEDLMKETRYHVHGTFVHGLSKGWLTSSVCLRKSLCIKWLKVAKFEMAAKQKRFPFRFRSCLKATWHQPGQQLLPQIHQSF